MRCEEDNLAQDAQKFGHLLRTHRRGQGKGLIRAQAVFAALLGGVGCDEEQRRIHRAPKRARFQLQQGERGDEVQVLHAELDVVRDQIGIECRFDSEGESYLLIGSACVSTDFQAALASLRLQTRNSGERRFDLGLTLVLFHRAHLGQALRDDCIRRIDGQSGLQLLNRLVEIPGKRLALRSLHAFPDQLRSQSRGLGDNTKVLRRVADGLIVVGKRFFKPALGGSLVAAFGRFVCTFRISLGNLTRRRLYLRDHRGRDRRPLRRNRRGDEQEG